MSSSVVGPSVSIDRIEVHNFKSYKGRQVIGPFTDFTAVIGPNGSGKSNLMDAICFGMGLRAGALRGGNLAELIYSGETGERKKTASVSIVLRKGGSGRASTKELVFQRRITGAGTSEYRVNGKAMTYEKYDEELKKLGLLTKSKNFLVFQGAVQKLSTKARNLTAILEEISGSAELRDPYSIAQRELEKKTEEVTMLAHRKRGMRSEKSEYKLQVQEMKRYRELLKERDEARSQKVMFQLFQLELELRTYLQELEKANTLVEEARAAEAAVDAALKQKEAEFAKFNKRYLIAEKEVKGATQRLAKERPNLRKAESSLRNALDHVEEQQALLQKLSMDEEQSLEKIAEMEEQLREVEESFELFEQQVATQQSQEFVEALGSQMEEYTVLKQQADQKTVTLFQKLERIRRENELTTQAKNSAESEKERLEEQKLSLVKELHQSEERLERLERALAEHSSEHETQSAKFQNLVRTRAENERRKTELEASLEQVGEEIKAAKSFAQESEREQRLSEAVEAMKVLYPRGVLGRLHDLCHIRREYAVAVTAAMGRNMDAVVVSNAEIAKECIKYLRDHRTGSATFLPLDSLSVKPVDKRVRARFGPNSASTSGKLIVDLVSFDSSVQRAVEFACGSTVVFDTLQEARAECFSKTLDFKFKAVTKDGSIIHKNGLMSGGASGLQRRAKRWEAVDMSELKSKKDRMVSSLKEIRQASRTQETDENRAKSLVESLEQKIKSCKLDIAATRRTVRQHEASLQNLDRLLQDNMKEISEANKKLVTQEARLKEIEEEKAKKTEEIFADFSSRVGVSDIREFEDKYVKESMATIDKRSGFQRHIHRLKNSIDYEKSRCNPDSIRKLQEELESDRATVAQWQEKVRKSEEKTKRLKAEVQEIEKQRDEAKRELETLSSQRKDLKGKKRAYLKDRVQREDGKSTVESKLLVTRSKRARLVQQAQLEEVDLPTGDSVAMEGSDPPSKRGKGRLDRGKKTRKGGRKGQRGKRGRGQRSGGSRRLSSLSDEDETSSSSGDSSDGGDGEADVDIPLVSEVIYLAEDLEEDASQSMDSQGKRRRFSSQRNGLLLSFATLREDLRRPMSPSQVDKCLSTLEAQIRTIIGQLEAAAPNRRAEEHMHDVDERFKVLSEEEQRLRDAQREAARAFEAIKEERRDRFLSAFEPISKSLEVIYQQLTRSPINETGGVAYLTLENQDEPYLGGVNYQAMPPAKKFREMDALSGGEQTVASLALLFAFQSVHPSPFFVMDEIDAALDEVNVGRLVRYVQERTCTSDSDKDVPSPCQFIIISLKESLYSRAKSLVGICRNTTEDCSQALSLNLQDFAE